MKRRQVGEAVKMKTVLFFMSGYQQAERRGRDEIMRYARSAGWRVHCVPYAEAEACHYRLLHNWVSRDVRGVLDFWKPDGCIVECGLAPSLLQPAEFSPVPTVFLDRDPTTLNEPATCVSSDADAIARAAYGELVSTGMTHFAFAGWHEKTPWTVQRESAFRAVLAANGRGMGMIDVGCPHKGGRRKRNSILESLNALPRPLAVFAVNDWIADQIISVCVNNGISVPNEVAVVGVDNAEDICENAIVSISSIRSDYVGSGRMACESLQQMFDSPGLRVPNRRFGVLSVVHRASTRKFACTPRVQGALEFIRQYADSGIEVNDVVKEMGCSRRQADDLFKVQVGHSILTELTNERIVRVKEMLASGDAAIKTIADCCGFASPNDLHRVFKRFTGMTPHAWRTASTTA